GERQLRRLVEPLDRGGARGRRRSSRHICRLGAPSRRAHAADALLPEQSLRGCERRLAAHVLRDVRLDLPADAVLPDRAGLLATRGGAADPPVDGDAVVRLAYLLYPVRP